MTIKEIAFQLGFKEPTNFSNYFKRITGIPPGKYRKQEQD
jgi:AraC-like DNA-binding protein